MAGVAADVATAAKARKIAAAVSAVTCAKLQLTLLLLASNPQVQSNQAMHQQEQPEPRDDVASPATPAPEPQDDVTSPTTPAQEPKDEVTAPEVPSARQRVPTGGVIYPYLMPGRCLARRPRQTRPPPPLPVDELPPVPVVGKLPAVAMSVAGSTSKASMPESHFMPAHRCWYSFQIS